MDDCIKLYALSTCIHCKHTKELLDKCGVVYDCTDVDTLEPDERRRVVSEIKESNPDCSFPMLVIGNKIIIGFRADEIKEALDLK